MSPIDLINLSAAESITFDGLRVGPLTRVDQCELAGPVVLGMQCLARRSRLGRYVVAGDHCRITDCDIGAFCSFGDNVLLNGGTHPKDWLSTSLFSCNPTFWDWVPEYRDARSEAHPSFQWRKPNCIGNDVWIGANVVVLSGITIGDGAIVGANSVVTRDIQPYSVVAGAPASLRKKRFDDQVIADIIASQWWTMPMPDLLALPVSDLLACLHKLKRVR